MDGLRGSTKVICECIDLLSSLLETMLDMYSGGDDAVPIAVRLQLAKQLQQAGIIGSVAVYMHLASDTIRGLALCSIEACHYAAASIQLGEDSESSPAERDCPEAVLKPDME